MLDRQIRGRVLRNLEAERGERNRLQTQSDWERSRSKVESAGNSIGPFPARTPARTRVNRKSFGPGISPAGSCLSKPHPAYGYSQSLFTGKAPAADAGNGDHPQPPPSQNAAELQDMGILWARSGCAVLIMDQIGHGERIRDLSVESRIVPFGYVMGMRLYVAGESLIKWMVWDIMRGVDLLLDRPDVNKDQILLLGAVAAGGDPAAGRPHSIHASRPWCHSISAKPRRGPMGPEAAGKRSWPTRARAVGNDQKSARQHLQKISTVDDLRVGGAAPARVLLRLGWQVEQQPAWARYQRSSDSWRARSSGRGARLWRVPRAG